MPEPTPPVQVCPLCGSASAAAFTTHDLNRRISQDPFHYRRCLGCGVIFLANVPEDLGRYYAGGYHRVPDASELDSWAAYEAYKLDMLRPLLDRGRVVDVGSSYGAFVHLAAREGYEVSAVEIDPQACAFIEDVLGVPAVQSAAPEEALGPMRDVDAVTMWHSIEHVRHPWRVVQAAARCLRPGGKLIVATPNPLGIQARWLKERWPHVDAPRHLFLIPRGSLVSAARSAGLAPQLMTSTDVETRRCNRMGWRRGLAELDVHVPGAWGIGTVLEVVARPWESRLDSGSAYVALFERR